MDTSDSVPLGVVANLKIPLIHTGMCSYQVQVRTSPNDGVYEVTGHVTSKNPYVNPEISRLDEYLDQPKCIMGSHPHMRKFCFCSMKI